MSYPIQLRAAASFFFCTIHTLYVQSRFNWDIPVAVIFSFPLPHIELRFK
jgi:hypothetical protein